MVCSAAAGAMGGAIAKTSIAPLDRTKIYFQTHPERNYRIKGAIRFLRKTYTQDGVFSLWRGNSATMARHSALFLRFLFLFMLFGLYWTNFCSHFP